MRSSVWILVHFKQMDMWDNLVWARYGLKHIVVNESQNLAELKFSWK